MRSFLCFILCLLLLTACSSAEEFLPTTSLRFTPLSFPYSNLGEFTLSDNQHGEQLALFLKVFDDTFKSGKIDDEAALHELANTFSLQLFSGNTLTAVYRLIFDFEKDLAFLQNEHHAYAISQENFHQIMETGYFNVIFQKNHAPTAQFYLNSKDIRYSVSGTWNYETYQDNFLSYRIYQQQEQATNYIVTDNDFHLSYAFSEKNPDQLYVSIRSNEQTLKSRSLLNSSSIEIPTQEGDYTYELEAVWSNPDLPYKAVLYYSFRIAVNYPPKVKLEFADSDRLLLLATVENYDFSGKVSASSALWEDEIPLTLINQQYYGLLPIPQDQKAGEYEITISGSGSSGSNENLLHKELVTVPAASHKSKTLTNAEAELLKVRSPVDPYLLSLADNHTAISAAEKLWFGSFVYPIARPLSFAYGQSLNGKDFSYQPFYQLYAFSEPTDVIAAANGIVRLAVENPENGYTVLLDHGLGVFSVYSGLAEIQTSAGSYLFSKQKLGTCVKSDKVKKAYFTYGIIVNGYYINPSVFFTRDPVFLYK